MSRMYTMVSYENPHCLKSHHHPERVAEARPVKMWGTTRHSASLEVNVEHRNVPWTTPRIFKELKIDKNGAMNFYKEAKGGTRIAFNGVPSSYFT